MPPYYWHTYKRYIIDVECNQAIYFKVTIVQRLVRVYYRVRFCRHLCLIYILTLCWYNQREWLGKTVSMLTRMILWLTFTERYIQEKLSKLLRSGAILIKCRLINPNQALCSQERVLRLRYFQIFWMDTQELRNISTQASYLTRNSTWRNKYETCRERLEKGLNRLLVDSILYSLPRNLPSGCFYVDLSSITHNR